jgi:C4-dicarboxylate-specific signal transduction histidine kinase
MDRAPTQEVDVNEGLDSALAILRCRLAGIEVERDHDESLPLIAAHGSELNQVWTNLIDNAVDAVADGDKTGRIRLGTTHERDRLLVEISDNGPGIPEEIQDRVFEPFFISKDVGKGVGFGLDVSYRIVVGRHGGVSASPLNPATPAFRCGCRWKRNAGRGVDHFRGLYNLPRHVPYH